MPDVRVTISLPFALLLADGDYPTADANSEIVRVTAGPPEESGSRTLISASFKHPDTDDTDEIQSLKSQDTDRLLRRTNKVLRWYRSVRRKADITERTRAQASPFLFEALAGINNPAWTSPIEYEEAGPAPVVRSVAEITATVKAGLATGEDPDVDSLFLLDAERALQQGRFREAILFCWSTIDPTFRVMEKRFWANYPAAS